MNTPLCVRARGLPPGIDAFRSPIAQALEEASGRRIQRAGRGQVAHLEIASSFGSGASRFTSRALGWTGRRLQRHGLNIERIPVSPRQAAGSPLLWWTGENLRPPATCSISLSFDIDTWTGTNFYWPLWHMLLEDEWTTPLPNFVGAPLLQSTLLAGRRLDPPPGFVAAIMGNATDERLHALQLLSALGPVEVYGSAVGRPIPSKSVLSGRYKFILAFENDLYPGYVTEKAIEAWTLGAVPIYWGLDELGFLNEGAIVSWNELGVELALTEIERLAGSGVSWSSRASEPMLAKRYPRDDLLSFLYFQLSQLDLI